MSPQEMIARMREKCAVLDAVLDARGRRLWAVTEAKAIGQGGQTLVAKATGLSRRTLYQGLRELDQRSGAHPEATQRARSPGGGRTPLTYHDPTLLADLEALVEPTSRGDPESPLRGTCTRVRQLAAELPRQGHKVGRQQVAALLADLADSRQGNRKTKEGTAPPDRHAPFEHINAQVAAFHKRRQPVLSVDTKKRELGGDFKHGGREWRPQGEPERVRTYDFVEKILGKVNPYGMYDQPANVGGVSVGVDHDAAEFAVESIQRWWAKMGAGRYQHATELLMTAPCPRKR